MSVHTFTCIDGHTCGNPVRLVAGGGPLPQIGYLFGRQRFLAAPVGSALFGERDAFPLPLADQGPLEFGERPHDRQH